MDPGAEVLTVEMKINLIAPASGASLAGRGRGRETGEAPLRGSGHGAGRGEDGTRRDVALLQGTMIPA
jgi:hypothetical protein